MKRSCRAVSMMGVEGRERAESFFELNKEACSMFTHTFKRKSAIMAMSIMFATAPFALAGNKATSASSGQDQHYQTSQGHSATSSSSAMDMQHHQAISATVEEVNQQENRVSLRLDDGNTVEMQVPAAMVSDLQQGDSVEVSIRK